MNGHSPNRVVGQFDIFNNAPISQSVVMPTQEASQRLRCLRFLSRHLAGEKRQYSRWSLTKLRYYRLCWQTSWRWKFLLDFQSLRHCAERPHPITMHLICRVFIPLSLRRGDARSSVIGIMMGWGFWGVRSYFGKRGPGVSKKYFSIFFSTLLLRRKTSPHYQSSTL